MDEIEIEITLPEKLVSILDGQRFQLGLIEFDQTGSPEVCILDREERRLDYLGKYLQGKVLVSINGVDSQRFFVEPGTPA